MSINPESLMNNVDSIIKNLESASDSLKSVAESIEATSLALKDAAHNIRTATGSTQNITDNLDNVAGGFYYSHSYDFNKGDNFLNQNEYLCYTLTEKEREVLRNAGCRFTLGNDDEINSVVDSNGLKLSPKQIAEILRKQLGTV